jgi:iron-sulfur cluster assembly protein
MTILEELNQITLTPAAAQAVTDLLAKRNLQGYSLRVFIQGGGCSGFQYGMALDNRIREDDVVFDGSGIKMIIDPTSYPYLKGATVDYVDDPSGSGFKISNPNVVSSCGCGNSEQGSESGSSGCGCGCH